MEEGREYSNQLNPLNEQLIGDCLDRKPGETRKRRKRRRRMGRKGKKREGEEREEKIEFISPYEPVSTRKAGEGTH